MFQQFDSFQKFGKDNVDLTLKAFGAVSKNAQAIAVEAADYAKRSFEQGTATAESLAGAKSIDRVIEIQTAYVKSSYETFVAQATKMGDLYAGLVKEAIRPFEGFAPKTAATTK